MISKEQILECVGHLEDIKHILESKDKIKLRVKIVNAKVNAALESLKEKEDYEKIHPISALPINERTGFLGR